MTLEPVEPSRGSDPGPGHGGNGTVEASGLLWHYQSVGDGPVMVLIHGTGASLETWRHLVPRLADRFRVVTFDLPGHGASARMTPGADLLPRMAAAIAAMLRALELTPVVLVGHSAGAAIAATLCLEQGFKPAALIAINGVLLPIRSVPLGLWSGMARLCAATPFVPRLIAAAARRPASMQRLIDSTGSRLDAEGVERYTRLATDPAHIAGVLDMLAGWSLTGLAASLGALTVPLLLLAADHDRTVSPVEAVRVRRVLPTATVVALPGCGHLAHEERPDLVVAAMEAFMAGLPDRDSSWR